MYKFNKLKKKQLAQAHSKSTMNVNFCPFLALVPGPLVTQGIESVIP